MKITTLILVTLILHVSASSLAQKVTLTEKNAPLTDVFEDIRNQTGYDFLFTGSDLKNARSITIEVKNADLKDVLEKVFAGQPLSYTIENKSVVVTVKEISLLDQLTDKVKSTLKIASDINGTVTDTLGNPLIGATVTIKGTTTTTQTDAKGNFSFPNIAQGKYILVASYVGYEKSEISVGNTGTNLRIGFVLHQGTSQLDQVRVIGYGTDSRRFGIGSYSTINASDIEKQPVNNILLALQGQAPGLAITSTSGIPGSQVLVQVRGQNTINSGSGLKPYDQPLIIIDGVPSPFQKNENINQFASLLNAQGSQNTNLSPNAVGISPFNNIDPADIESVSVLKDADATSIYGSKGANGVILITTKKGKAGATTLDLNVNTSFNSVGRPVQLLNTAQYLQLRKDAFASDGITPSNSSSNFSAYAPDLTIYDQNKYTDWEKVIYGQNTTNTGVHASISGGTVTNTFLISTGYNRSSYNYPGNFSDQRYTLHSSLHHNSIDSKLTIDLTTDFGYEQNTAAGFGGANDVIFSPNLPDLLSPSGGLNWAYQGVDLTSYQFYSSLLQPTYLQNYNFNSSFHLGYRLLKGLTVSANLGYNRNYTNENSQNPGVSQNPLYGIVRQANFSTNTAQTINIEPQIDYKKNFGKGIFSALIGGTYRKTPTYSTYTSGTGYSNDNFLGSINGVTVTAGDVISYYKYVAGFARFNYIYNNEFIIQVAGRRDGSSNFGPGRQFGNFGSVAGGWIFSEESLIKKSLPVLSYGKISGSYGTTGSDGSSAYLFQALFKAISFVPTFQGTGPSYQSNLYNPNFGWATKTALNIALDLGFFNNRLLLNATYYRNREGDQLTNYPLPVQVGISSVLANLDATVQNQGLEFTASSTNVKTKNFSWSSNFNLSFNRNKLLAFPNLASSTYSSQYEIGQPTSTIYGYMYKDVNPTTGLFEFYKSNGTVTSSPNFQFASAGGDKVSIGNRELKYAGGFGNALTYRNLTLYVFCQFASQMAPNYLYQVYNNQLGFMKNVPTAVLGNYWKAPGDAAQLQRLASSYSTPFIAAAGTSATSAALNFVSSSGAYSNDTYLRVKTVSLSYQLPAVLLSKVHIKGANIFMNAQNLLTFTNYKVGDPEQPGTFTSFPVQRVLAFGLNLKF